LREQIAPEPAVGSGFPPGFLFAPLRLSDMVDVIALAAVGTVMTPEPAVEAAYGTVGRRHGSRLSDGDIATRFRQVFANRALGETTSDPLEHEFWRAVVGEVLPDTHAPEACFSELFAWFGQPQAWRLYPDVLPALWQWRQAGVRVVLASNFDSRLRAVWSGLAPGWGDLPLCISSEVGYRKPSPKFFSALCQQVSVAADRILMVGDSWREDVVGSRDAGLRAAWICRQPVHAPPGDREGIPRCERLTELSPWPRSDTQPPPPCDLGAAAGLPQPRESPD